MRLRRPSQALLALALLVSAAAPARPPVPGAGEAEARFEVRLRSGRGTLARGETVETLTAVSGAREGSGPAALELGPAARAELAWPGRASLRLEGAALLEWKPLPENRLELYAQGVSDLELEVRRSFVVLDLDGGWALEIEGAALGLEEAPEGGWVVRHHAGRSVRVRSRIPRSDERWPRRLTAGQTVRLAP